MRGNSSAHLRGKRFRCKPHPSKRTIELQRTPIRMNSARVRVCNCRARSLRNGHKTNTLKSTASAVSEAERATRCALMRARFDVRLVSAAVMRAPLATCRSRRCLLSIARALFAEVLLSNLSPHLVHTATAIGGCIPDKHPGMGFAKIQTLT